MSIDLSKMIDDNAMSDNEINTFLEPFIKEHVQRAKQFERDLSKTNADDVIQKIKEHLLTNGYYSTGTIEAQDVEEHIIESRIASYFNIDELITYTGLMEYQSNLPYTEFVDVDKLGTEIMFTMWFVPFRLNNQHFVIDAIRGQGEQFINIYSVDDKKPINNDDSNFKAVTKWYSFSDILAH